MINVKNPAAEQIDHDKQRSKTKVRGTLILHDVLDGLTLRVEQWIMDAIVHVSVLQHGSRDFEIANIRVPNKLIIMTNQDGRELVINYDIKTSNTETNTLLEKFTDAVSLVVLEKARSTPEDFWTYEVVD